MRYFEKTENSLDVWFSQQVSIHGPPEIFDMLETKG